LKIKATWLQSKQKIKQNAFPMATIPFSGFDNTLIPMTGSHGALETKQPAVFFQIVLNMKGYRLLIFLCLWASFLT